MYATPRKAITQKQRKRLLARAKTLSKKADELMTELMELVGEEHASTDYADNVIVAAEELVDVISNANYEMWNPATSNK
jgi:hypothetical protein